MELLTFFLLLPLDLIVSKHNFSEERSVGGIIFPYLVFFFMYISELSLKELLVIHVAFEKNILNVIFVNSYFLFWLFALYL